eukprot:TRINITY_DN10388_c0_g1_i1.p1 TRINITY_DN10388_c0_g1~~TRINITY_DN10388_c0_g1_i1.p1  ORF type:complete len:250 (+),score=75.18 TRINITY_DN10388_c0_g1_i1:49-798(+)
MYLTRSEYDQGVNTFSPQGRIFQVEYAIEAIKLGSTSIGIQTSEGIVLVAEKRLTSPLLIPKSIEKLVEIDTNIGCAMAGLSADAKTLIDHARVEAQYYHFTYDETISTESIAQSICDLALRFGEDRDEDNKMSRPFGVSLLIGGIDENGPVLWHTDPSGTFLRYSAKAIGGGSEGAQGQLEKEYYTSMSLEDAQLLALQVLRQVMEEKISARNIEMGIITTEEKKFRTLTVDELENWIDRLQPIIEDL